MTAGRAFGRSRPSTAYELAFRRELKKLGEEMRQDVERALGAFLEGSAPVAQDAAMISLAQTVKALREKWYKEYAKRGRVLAKWLADKTDKRTMRQIMRKLKETGFSVTPAYGPAQQELISGIVEQNVSLIKAIPQQYLRRVQRAAAVTFKRGQDVGLLTKVLKRVLEQCGRESENHAALIARDQTQKATQAFAIANAQAFGARRGRWIHVPGKYSARITHMKMDGQVFDLDKGIYDADCGQWVKPGELYYCNCQFEVLMPGFED